MNRLGAPHRPLRGFTLTELLTTIAIIAILSSLSLAGLAVARQRVKADRTEMTIRKIHEVVMPHYEGFLTRSFPLVSNTSAMLAAPLQAPAKLLVDLMTKRRALVIEMPDGWADLIDTGTAPPAVEPTPSPRYSAIALRLRSMVPAGQVAA
ncbi:MAG: type II secretion system protein, partial [Sphaerospermopsis kisseleviana]